MFLIKCQVFPLQPKLLKLKRRKIKRNEKGEGRQNCEQKTGKGKRKYILISYGENYGMAKYRGLKVGISCPAPKIQKMYQFNLFN